jgi:hypothetical protein
VNMGEEDVVDPSRPEQKSRKIITFKR